MQRDLFAATDLAFDKTVQFYEHRMDWANRLVLGDSLTVMSSLRERENMAGAVQMVYFDPPYGIKFGSNFQPEVGQRKVEDKPEDLTREPEQVRAYRDTWHLGVHSYLAYLRDRLVAARELLAKTGSIFVQISDDNMHRVRQVLDEVFGAENFRAVIAFTKGGGGLASSRKLTTRLDYLLWYAKDARQLRYYPLRGEAKAEDAADWDWVEEPGGHCRRLTSEEKSNGWKPDEDQLLFNDESLTKPGPGSRYTIQAYGRTLDSGKRWWGTPELAMYRLIESNRAFVVGNTLRRKKFAHESPPPERDTLWDGIGGQSKPIYVVQTNVEVIRRCIYMTTKPGDLVLDPTCGSGSTGVAAEEAGRRWIVVDTSRVALALARQRMLTENYPMFRLREVTDTELAKYAGSTWLRPLDGGIKPHTFKLRTAKNVTSSKVSGNTHLDPIFERHRPKLDAALDAVNAALANVTDDLRATLAAKLADKMQAHGLRAATDADRRRWLLPGTAREQVAAAFAGRSKLKARHVKAEAEGVPPDGRFEHWHVPFDSDPDWPAELAGAVAAYRAAWRAKMDAVNACIAEHAESEVLVDKPEEVKNVVRVSGPFTVEAVQPAEFDLSGDHQAGTGEFAGAPETLPDGFDPADGPPPATKMRTVSPRRAMDAANAAAYIDGMLTRLRDDGVTFPNNRRMEFSRLDRLDGDAPGLHAEGRWHAADAEDDDPEGEATAGVMIGPQYGNMTAAMVEAIVKPAGRLYDDLVIAAFGFDGAAQEVIESRHPPADDPCRLHPPGRQPGDGGVAERADRPREEKGQAESRRGAAAVHGVRRAAGDGGAGGRRGVRGADGGGGHLRPPHRGGGRRPGRTRWRRGCWTATTTTGRSAPPRRSSPTAGRGTSWRRLSPGRWTRTRSPSSAAPRVCRSSPANTGGWP